MDLVRSLTLPRLSVALLLGFSACSAPRGLDALVLRGADLHASLTSRPLHAANHGVPRAVRSTPHFSKEPEFCRALAGFASQGQLAGDGICAGLFAIYESDQELGFYGLETSTDAHAERLEARLREIWVVNIRHDRAKVHRSGRKFLVVWHDGVSPDCWSAANATLRHRLHGE